jgi:ribosomal protein S27AE
MSKHETITPADLHMRAKPACGKCGSSHVWVEAFASWNERLQRWDVVDLLDGNSTCCNCGQATEIKWRLEK